MMKRLNKINLKYILLLLFYLAILITLRFLWFTTYVTPEHPLAKQGVMDLRGWNFEDSRSIKLDGEWEFYPGQFITYGDNTAQSRNLQKYTQVPGDWSAAFPEGEHPSFGYGTYRLRILIDQPLNQPYGFWIQRIQAASVIEINGQAEQAFGRLGKHKNDYSPNASSYLATYNAEGKQEIELLVRSSNYDHPHQGGIVRSIRFGSQAAIDTEHWYSIGFQLVTFVILMLHAFYAGILFFFNPRQKAFLLFFMLLTAVSLSIVTDNDILLLRWLPINYTWTLKLKLLSYIGLSCFMLLLSRSFSGKEQAGRLLKGYVGVLLLYSLFLLAAPAEYIFYTLPIFTWLYLLPIAGVVYYITQMVVKKKEDAVFLLLAAAAIVSSILWGVVQSKGQWTILYYPIDIIASIIGFSAYWFKRYFRNSEDNLQLTRQLQEGDRLKDQFLANTSHELRTPLHGIISIAQTVASREKTMLDPHSNKDMELLITIGRRMSHLLNDLLDVTRLKDKRIVLQREPLAIQSLVSGVMDMFGFMTEGKNLQLINKISPFMPPVLGDEKRMVQILFNLLHNAIKYTQEGTITVRAEISGKYAAISVSDTGEGIDQETQKRIFSPYEQGSMGINDGGGIGLGLSISKQLAELHHGDLVVESQPGKGSVFTFTLPLADSSGQQTTVHLQSSTADIEPLTAGHATWINPLQRNSSPVMLDPQASPQLQAAARRSLILAVDDDPINLKVLANMLSGEHVELTAVVSAHEALELLGTQPWDLLIADVMMPHMSGYELTRNVRQYFSASELPILLLTARNQPEDIYTGFLSGANDYVAKPVDALELKYRVRSLTGLKQSVDEHQRMEAAYLQAQIQPHFLFNTLNSLMALSELDLPKMRDLGEAFSSYLRISFDFMNSHHLVGLSHELELVQAYLFIEKARFEERLNVEWDIQEGVDLLIPPLTLQPLVENAVRHGLLSQAQGGTIQVRISRREGLTAFEVQDNGKGMTKEQIRQLLDLNRYPSEGIGILNTNRRLTQLYGQGLDIDSEPGAGTTVSFMIPDQRKKRETALPPL
ncbi:hybrid sensor histidine kinase/response regulator [Paenibacillus donghaensis]|uniref:histidine kinase n=1 Tax=Paenibacillus donghaensis TaxID=414771 RepID=A0A2Z2KPN4_9BACL|nr:ATP-binding protein [Paenibacillus donghaensis]ASA23282.1 histidine kinase [Paenibacillus donghaensis]